MSRLLIVNADDLGMTSGVNRGIVAAYRGGVVTSGSLMVRRPTAHEAAAIAQANPALAIGLHVELGEWVYVDGDWREAYHVVNADDPAAVERELKLQLERFERIVSRPPTHLDSHQHVHREEPVASALARAGSRLKVPVRDQTPGIRFCGAFHGQCGRGEPYPEGITVDALVALIERLPDGITELCTHPGEADELESSYANEREVELQTLCDPRVRDAVRRSGVALKSFAEVSP